MDMKAVAGDVTTVSTPALVVNLFQGVTSPGGATGAIDVALEGAITKLIAEGEVTGREGELTLIHTLGKLPAQRILVAGLGKQEKFSPEVVRQVMGNAGRYVRRLNVRRFATIAHGAGIAGIPPAASGQAMAEGAVMGLYAFNKYKSRDPEEPQRELDEILVVERDAAKLPALEAGFARGRVIAESVNFARDMSNEPANVLTPTEMAERALQMCREAGLECEVLDRPQMQELGMGALLAVAAGSAQPPKFIIMQYRGDPANPSNNIALCGKGITFDSGGINIKGGDNMGNMKGDMAAGAAVMGAMKAIAYVKPRINVMGLVAATENMPGGSASRPADVVRAMSGKSIEIDNTDAEGRLVLADALSYARQHNMGRIVDAGTLTGTPFGNLAAAIMGTDQELVERIIRVGEATGERYWQMPMWEEYREGIRSNIADIKNTGGRGAGSIAAAYFIREFAGDASWAHLDIASVARTEGDRGYLVRGHTGFAVRTFVGLVEELGRG
ncbi:MAG: leucyl aminopeptidase [Chloroflexi bacterium]|nr:leucyl aminopeptidase [Chloroflexota bacterium]